MRVACLALLAAPLCCLSACSDQGEFKAASPDGGLGSPAAAPAPLELPPGIELLPPPSEVLPTDPEEVEQAAETASAESFNVILELVKPPESHQETEAEVEAPEVTLTTGVGTGLLLISTEQAGDAGDEMVWIKEDVNGDGTLEELQVVVDDEEQTTYVAFSLPGPCDDGSAGITEFIIADNGFDRRMLAASTCPGASGAVVTCNLDEEGNPTSCATCEEDGGTFICSPVGEAAPPTAPDPEEPPTAPDGSEPPTDTPATPPANTGTPAPPQTPDAGPPDAGSPAPGLTQAPPPPPSMVETPVGTAAPAGADGGGAD